jgi:hypothetical protein
VVNDPIQDLRDITANVTAHPNHVAIIAAHAVLHLADELAEIKKQQARAKEISTFVNGIKISVVDNTIDDDEPALDHILDEMT